MIAPLRFGPRPCRLCGQALSALERVQGDVCHRLDCRRRGAAERRAAARAADLARRQRSMARLLEAPALAVAPVLWLQPYEAHLVPVPEAARREQVAWLDALAALPPQPDLPPPADDTPGPPIAGRVCAFCRGRCCSFGALRHGFVDRALLQRHAARHGLEVAAAAQAYAARVPKAHVHGGCIYQGRDGCVLPRPMRADVCTAYRCEPLVEATGHAGQAAGVVLAMALPQAPPRAAWARDEALRPLPRRPRRAALRAPKRGPAVPR